MNPFEGQSAGITTSEDEARRWGLQNWARSYLPSRREIPALEEAGIPARGPVQMWSPLARGITPPANPFRTGRSLIFGDIYKPLAFENRWLGVHPDTGAAMRSPDPSSRQGSRGVQRMSLELYGGNKERLPSFALLNPFSQQIIRSAARAEEARRAGPGFQDSWSRVSPYVLWGLDEPGRYGRQPPP